jgi:hypothetical protein
MDLRWTILVNGLQAGRVEVAQGGQDDLACARGRAQAGFPAADVDGLAEPAGATNTRCFHVLAGL